MLEIIKRYRKKRKCWKT